MAKNALFIVFLDKEVRIGSFMSIELGRKPKINLDTFTRLFEAKPVKLNDGNYFDEPHIAIWRTKRFSVGQNLVMALRMLESQVIDYRLDHAPIDDQFSRIRLQFIPKRKDADIMFSHKSRLPEV